MRIRVTFSKAGAMRYVGHLDLHRSWERTFRRSGLPLTYSQGFHPQPRLNLACALPLGFTSQCELLDAWLDQEFSVDFIQQSLCAALPPGLEIYHVESISLQSPALQTQVTSVVYLITFLDEIPSLQEKINMLISSEHLPRLRRNKPYDLRPLIERVEIISSNNGQNTTICAQLAAREGATGRPEEMLDQLGIRFEATRIHREKILLTTD